MKLYINLETYVDTFEEEEINLFAVRTERKALLTEMARLEDNMSRYLKELGYDA